MSVRLSVYICVAGLAAVLMLSGCASVALEGANITKDKVEEDLNMKAALAGDAEAQFKVGESMCCSLDGSGPGFYNTQQAISWLCKSAAQSYGPAALKLGDVYSGNMVSGVRVMRRVAEKVEGPPANLPVAFAWLLKARALDQPAAIKASQDVWLKMTPADQAKASALATDPAPLACEWKDVIGRG